MSIFCLYLRNVGCNEKPKLLERKKIFDRVVAQLLDIINKFDDALGALAEEE